MSLRSGKTSTGLDKFTAQDICKIISSCAKSGVTDLVIGDSFRVQFGRTDNSSEIEAPEKANQVKLRTFPQGAVQAVQSVAEVSQIKKRSEEVEDELQELSIANPYEYEELMAQGDLEHAEEKIGGSQQDVGGI